MPRGKRGRTHLEKSLSVSRTLSRLNAAKRRIEALRTAGSIDDAAYQELMTRSRLVYRGAELVAGELDVPLGDLFGISRAFLECRADRHSYPRRTRVISFVVDRLAGPTFWSPEVCERCNMVRLRQRYRSNLRLVKGSHAQYRPPAGYSINGAARRLTPSDLDSVLLALEFEDHLEVLERRSKVAVASNVVAFPDVTGSMM